jgi:TRAP-type C4-dicarboxylate transport system substrate-binding protein
MKITKRQLRRIIKEVAEEAAEFKSTAGKKTEKLMDSNAMNAFKVALDKANSKDAVKETLSQVFASLGENGQKYLKQALKELAAEL